MEWPTHKNGTLAITPDLVSVQMSKGLLHDFIFSRVGRSSRHQWCLVVVISPSARVFGLF